MTVQQTRDPFVSLLETGRHSRGPVSGLHGVRDANDIELQGLIYDQGAGSFVIANGVVLMEGETKGDVTVVEIDENGARFLIQNELYYKPYQRTFENGE